MKRFKITLLLIIASISLSAIANNKDNKQYQKDRIFWLELLETRRKEFKRISNLELTYFQFQSNKDLRRQASVLHNLIDLAKNGKIPDGKNFTELSIYCHTNFNTTGDNGVLIINCNNNTNELIQIFNNQKSYNEEKVRVRKSILTELKKLEKDFENRTGISIVYFDHISTLELKHHVLTVKRLLQLENNGQIPMDRVFSDIFLNSRSPFDEENVTCTDSRKGIVSIGIDVNSLEEISNHLYNQHYQN